MKTNNYSENKDNQSFVIFGGAGFIGSHMVDNLRKRGIRKIVVAVIAEKIYPKHSNVLHKKYDVREKIPSDLISGHAVIINLAAVHRTPVGDYGY